VLDGRIRSMGSTHELLSHRRWLGIAAAIYVTDAEGHITYCNQSAVDLWGVKPTLGKDKWSDLSHFYHADGSPMALQDCPTEIALKHGHIVRGREAIIERKDGTRMPIAPYPTPLRDETGAIVGVVNMTVDISERKKAELALAERNIQLALAGKAALVGSYAYDIDTEIMQISAGYAAIHGFPEGTAEKARSDCLASVHPDDIGRVGGFRREAFRERRREYTVEYRIIRAGGEVRWVETRCFVSYDGEGRPHRVVGVSIDITERKQVEEQQRKLVAELIRRRRTLGYCGRFDRERCSGPAGARAWHHTGYHGAQASRATVAGKRAQTPRPAWGFAGGDLRDGCRGAHNLLQPKRCRSVGG
jgi:PAS domain S-box-containing protein